MPDTSPFVPGSKYSRQDVQRALGLEPQRWGDWYIGFHQHDGAWYLFSNVGIPGRTGHEYANRWEGDRFHWYAQERTQPHQETFRSLTAPGARVLLFTRAESRAPFTYEGAVVLDELNETARPIEVWWRVAEPFSLPEEVVDPLRVNEGAVPRRHWRQRLPINSDRKKFPGPDAKRQIIAPQEQLIPKI